ncbi:MAG: hypothetical protein P4L99_02640 [Chthoniobacter sp.]|nr:hypothetical protein [Chthoniobacter sp.]
MPDSNHELNRLLKAASRAAGDGNDAPPLGFETRVLAQWRETRRAPASTALYRQAVILSAVLACLAFVFIFQDWVAFRNRNDWPGFAQRVVDSEFQRQFR